MDNVQALLYLVGLITYKTKETSHPGNLAIYGQGEVALVTLANALGISLPADQIPAWTQYVDTLYNNATNTLPHEPPQSYMDTRKQTPPAEARPRSESAKETPGDFKLFVQRAEDIIAKCDTLQKTHPKGIDFACSVADKAKSMREWMLTNQRVTVKMEVALTNMSDSVDAWLIREDKSNQKEEDDTPPWAR